MPRITPESASRRVAKSVDEEFSPITDFRRIGIEVEGVGAVRTDWPDHKNKAPQSDNFHEIFKRTPLVRSDSFDKGRGVFIAPEDGGGFGISSPAELVSQPHRLSRTGLDKLRDSYTKAVTSCTNNPMLKKQSVLLNDPRLPEDHRFNKLTAESRWARTRPGQVAGNLQTTIGVAVEQLLSDNKQTRIDVVKLLVADRAKRRKTRDLLLAAICIEKCLTAEGRPLAAYKNKQDGIRLSIFMYLISALCLEASNGLEWAKCTFGASFKGNTSFEGCGVEGAKEKLVDALTFDRGLEEVIISEIVREMKKVDLDKWVVSAFEGRHKNINLKHIGDPGLSLQTLVERWFAIPNFFSGGRLHTVIESRERDSGLNLRMADFLNGQKDSASLFEEIEAVVSGRRV